MLGTYGGLSPETSKRILLDFSKVEYLNSSGIALIIQLLYALPARRARPSRPLASRHTSQKVFTMVGITKYTKLYPDEATACAGFE